MNPKIIITGASGFLGYHLLKEAKKQGLYTLAAVRKNSQIDHIKDCTDEFIHLDYTSVTNLKSSLETTQAQYIIHAAALTRSKDPNQYTQVNVQFAENLALAAAQVKSLQSFVYVSSLAAIGPVAYHAAPIVENSPKNPVTLYGKSKQEAEKRILAVPNLPLSIFRPTAIYGPREKDLLVLFKTILSGLDAYIGKAPQKLTFIHGQDAALAMLKAATQQIRGTFNLTDGNVYDRYAVANIIHQYKHKKGLRIHLPVALIKAFATLSEWAYTFSKDYPVLYRERIKEVTAESWECDSTQLKKQLQFTPIYDLNSGLIQTLEWYQKEQWL